MQPPERRKASTQDESRRQSGQSESRPGTGGATIGFDVGGVENYLNNHRETAKDSLLRLLQNPIANFLTWAVIAIALALPTGMLAMLANIEQLGQNWSGIPRISLFLDLRMGESQAHQLQQIVRKKSGVGEVAYVSPAAALKEFTQQSGFGEVVQYLDENPLPPLLIVTPSDGLTSAHEIETLFNVLKELPGVERAQLDLHWVKRLYSMMNIAERAIVALGLMLAIAVLLIIGNTIRLAIENRRHEIVVMKLVGGTDTFVRRPFLYTGVWYGLGGGLLAWLLVFFWFLWLSGPVEELAALYGTPFRLSALGFTSTLYLLMASIGLGWAGAWLAVKRHLDAIEPH